MRPHRVVSIAGGCAALLLLTGCPNPNLYTTPRTLDPGKVQWQLAPEGIAVTANNFSGGLPMVPTFGARVGMADGFDMGFRLTNLDSLAIDGKVRLVKSTVDLALDPGLQGFYENINGVGLGVLYMHLPLLVGFNLSKNVTIVAAPGGVFAYLTANENSSGLQSSATANGFLGRLGLGLDVRTSKSLAIHPEVTAMQSFTGSDATIWVFGLGFNIGAQPDYSDLGGEATQDEEPGSSTPTPTAAPAPSASTPAPASPPAPAP